jgi:hypothetical protein
MKVSNEWSGRCFQEAAGERRVKAAYIRNIVADKFGYATIVIAAPRELVAVNRRGVVVVPGIYHIGDFDYPDAEAGIGRYEVTVKNERGVSTAKCGYFRSPAFKIVIPATYDECHPFREGVASACTDCQRYCTEYECQNSVFVGGRNVVLDGANKVVGESGPNTLEDLCGGAEYVRVAST